MATLTLNWLAVLPLIVVVGLFVLARVAARRERAERLRRAYEAWSAGRDWPGDWQWPPRDERTRVIVQVDRAYDGLARRRA